jgi:transcription elongation GreA/GreB family factor
MPTTRMTGPMRRSLESRLADLDARIETLKAQRKGDDSVEATALLIQLTLERSDIADALQNAVVIDDEPFDTEAIEIGDTVTIRDADGESDRYVLVDGKVRSRARNDWVSVSSPLGSALLGRSKGARVHVESPAGPTSYVIVDFERASEDSVVLAESGDRVSTPTDTRLPSEAFLG